MQTFLPYSDYLKSMQCLDKDRLGNQVWREGLTLIRGKWPNHPASKMWRGHFYSLGEYLLIGVQVLNERVGTPKYDYLRERILAEMNKHENTGVPPWFGNEAFHAAHRAALLYKRPEWYSQFGWQEKPDVPDKKGKLNYVWPV
jgi:hypothetical protein